MAISIDRLDVLSFTLVSTNTEYFLSGKEEAAHNNLGLYIKLNKTKVIFYPQHTIKSITYWYKNEV
jgi:hypothetical protein